MVKATRADWDSPSPLRWEVCLMFRFDHDVSYQGVGRRRQDEPQV